MIFRLERGFVMAQANAVLVKGAKVQKKKNRNSIERKKERTALSVYRAAGAVLCGFPNSVNLFLFLFEFYGVGSPFA